MKKGDNSLLIYGICYAAGKIFHPAVMSISSVFSLKTYVQHQMLLGEMKLKGCIMILCQPIDSVP